MATIRKRRNGDATTSWDAMVRVVGYPATGKSFSTKLAAELWAAQTEDARRGRAAPPKRRLTLAMLIDEGLPRLTKPTTAIFAYWREHLGAVRLDRITPELVALHRDRLLEADCRGHGHKTAKRRTSATVRNYLIEISRLFALAAKELRVMDSNPCTRVTKPKASNQVVRYLSDDERKALLAACKTSESPDLYPFVLFALTTGARKGELTALKWAHVDLRRRWATFPHTKNGEARGVPLTVTVCALLEARTHDADLVFPVDITKAWHTAIKRAGIVNFRFHDLRHSCASALVQNGANLAEVAKLLGHKGLQMTMRYSHIGDDGTQRLVDRVMEGVA